MPIHQSAIHHRTTDLQNPGSPSSNCHRFRLRP